MDTQEIKSIAEYIRKSVRWLKSSDCGCCTYELDDRLAICVGWLGGFDSDADYVIHSKTEPEYAIVAGIKVHTSDSMRTDYEWINAPYSDDDGEVWDTTCYIAPKENYVQLAKYFAENYEEMSDFDIDESGRYKRTTNEKGMVV